MNTFQLILLVIFGLAAIWFGWRVFKTSSMIRSAMSLLASMVAIGALFLVMRAEFLGILQIMMMAAEMTIMGFFMMMYMMDLGGMSGMEMTHQKKPAAAAGIAGAVLVLLVVLLTDWPGTSPAVPTAAQQNHALGMELMDRSMMIFETAGVTILTAMIAAAATALKFKHP